MRPVFDEAAPLQLHASHITTPNCSPSVLFLLPKSSCCSMSFSFWFLSMSFTQSLQSLFLLVIVAGTNWLVAKESCEQCWRDPIHRQFWCVSHHAQHGTATQRLPPCNSGTTVQVRMMLSLSLCHCTGVHRPVQVLRRRCVCLNCPVPSCALETVDEVGLLRECWCFGVHFWVCALLHFAHANIGHATA